MITIQPQYLTFAKLCDGRLFRIPEYQRAYSWTTHQRKDLFDDIIKTHSRGDEEGHFMAAVVCLRRKKQSLGTDEYHVMEVVDGQQRLTTLILLLKAVEQALNRKQKPEAKLQGELAGLLVKEEADELLLLQTNHDSSHFFATFLRKGNAPTSEKAATLADREILGAIEECRAFVSTWAKDESLLTLAALLKNRLHFLLHEIEEERTVYTVFEVLNSRGLDVSWFDRLKSILMGAAFELKKTNHAGVIQDLHTIWRDIYAVIGLRLGLSTEVLRFAATLRSDFAPSRLIGESDAVAALRSEATTARKIRAVAAWLLDVAKACDAVVADVRINAVTRISQARLMAVAITLSEKLSRAEKKALLRRWEKVSFRIYGMLGHDARTRVGDYVRLGWRVVNEKPPFEEIDDAIGVIGEKFTIEDAVDGLRNANCYEDWENELRYLLYRFEEHLAREQKLNFSNEQWAKIWLVNASESIEHIWARSQAPDDHRHRLGNLTLLPPRLNSKLQDLAPKDKMKYYRKTGLLIAGEAADSVEKGKWDAGAIEDRENRILEWVRDEWAD